MVEERNESNEQTLGRTEDFSSQMNHYEQSVRPIDKWDGEKYSKIYRKKSLL